MSNISSNAGAGGPPPPGQGARKNDGRRGPPPPTDSLTRIADAGGGGRDNGRKKKKKSSGILASIVISIAFALAASKYLPFVLLLMIGLAPTWIAILSEADPFRARIATVAQLNLAGTLPFFATLWQQGGQMRAFLDIMSDVYTWIAMFGSAGAALALLWAGPQGMTMVRRTFNAARRLELEREQAQIIDEWGEEVSAPGAASAPAKAGRAWLDV
jgi:hypothetical protein